MVQDPQPSSPISPNQQMWSALCHDAGVAVMVCDRSGEVVYANEYAGRCLRWQQQAATAEVERRAVQAASRSLVQEERARFIAQVCESRTPLAYECLVRGIRHFVTIRPTEREGTCHALIVGRRMHAWERAEALVDGSTQVVECEAHDAGILATLSPRELDVLVLLGEGLPHADIAERLGLSVRTIERHRDRLGQKLRAGNRVDLARFAIRAGLAGLPDPALVDEEELSGRNPLDLSAPLQTISRRRVRVSDVD